MGIPNYSNAYKEQSAMCIYCGTKEYRKIYEIHHGPILKDELGRTYEIHHIDGNHSNNCPDNLKSIPIQEHYDIHFAQKDYLACWMISLRLNVPPEVRSELMSIAQQKRVKDGTHHWLGGSYAKRLQNRLIKEGKHQFLDPEFSKKHSRQRVKDGTHNFLGGKIQKSATERRLVDGTHHMLGRKEVECPHCGETGHKPIMARWHFNKCKFKL